jgi:hypothetical protein
VLQEPEPLSHFFNDSPPMFFTPATSLDMAEHNLLTFLEYFVINTNRKHASSIERLDIYNFPTNMIGRYGGIDGYLEPFKKL